MTAPTGSAGPGDQRPTVDVENLMLPPEDSGEGSGEDLDDETDPLYETMAAWFHGWFHQVVERQTSSGLIWCPQWWRHNEAIAILDALWMAWEGARLDEQPDAMLLWWERAIGLLHHLTSPDHGPFAGCTSRRHQIQDGDLALPHDPEPPGWFGIVLDTTGTVKGERP